jgi:esterase/lipase superfamily enzyme
VFVHGYNVGFEDAIKRAAQIAFDLNFDGLVMLFTWPSKARLFGYVYDRKSAHLSIDHLVTFIDGVAKELPNTKLHLVAHSMGNVVVLNALRRIAQRSNRINIGEVILAHPDVSRRRLAQLAGALKSLGQCLTLYASRSDRAMWASWLWSGRGRAGGAPAVVSGIDTIDITGLGASLWNLNHGVYAGNPIVFGDIARLVQTGERPPNKRTRHYEPVETELGTYWRYRAPDTAHLIKNDGTRA